MENVISEVIISFIVILFLCIAVLLLFSEGARGKVMHVWIRGHNIVRIIWHTLQNEVNDSRMSM